MSSEPEENWTFEQVDAHQRMLRRRKAERLLRAPYHPAWDQIADDVLGDIDTEVTRHIFRLGADYERILKNGLDTGDEKA